MVDDHIILLESISRGILAPGVARPLKKGLAVPNFGRNGDKL
jgi:hypothetical protein